MFQQFFTDTIESKFIKSLLSSTPIPTLPITKEGGYIIEGCFYIFGRNIIKCTQSGYVPSSNTRLLIGDDSIASNSTILNSGVIPGKFDIIDTYEVGKDSIQMSEKYFSKYSYYDSDTHYYLGQYLRALRDINNIDLMPFYNCFNYRLGHDFYLTNSTNGYLQNGDYGYDFAKSNMVKTLMVPIKFDTSYTIAIDCSSQVYMKSILYGQLGMLNTYLISGASGNITNYLMEDNGRKLTSKSFLSFKDPQVYSISHSSHTSDITDAEMKQMERNLYLVIQLPISNNSSVVVLEGDYTKCGVEKVFNMECIDKISSTELDNALLTNLSLLQFNDRQIYAFSNRLIEYLLLNVIDKDDEIWQNIQRVREYTGYSNDVMGVWDNKLRAQLFEKYVNDLRTKKLDINGYVDKDMERLITRGIDV